MIRRATTSLAVAAATALAAAAVPAAAKDRCRPLTHDGQSYTVCEAHARNDDLRLWHSDADGAPLGGFDQIATRLRRDGRRLGFAMNAGMFHGDRSPVGLYVEDGETRAPLITREGPGNFGMLPNGVFCIRDDSAAVIESRRFAAQNTQCRHATQSGPMLVIDGALHPRFLPDSDSRHIRNGVGVTADGGRAIFAISDAPVTFHEFARLFRDVLDTPQALYLDGKVSRLHAPGLERSDWGLPVGPIVGVAEPAGDVDAPPSGR